MSQVSSPEVTQIAQSYLQMPYNQFVWLRKEFMCLCGDALEAMIMRVVEYEIEGDRRAWLRHATELIEQGKPAPEEPEWWISLSHKQIQVRLYDAIKNEKTLRAKLKALIEDKRFLLMRDNPNNRYGSPQYTINKELIQKKLNDLPPLPGIKEAAKSQSNPLPETVPPTNIGTSSQSRQEGGTRNGTSPLPNLVPAPYQDREVPPAKTGTPYKKDKNSSKNFNKNIEEEKDIPTSCCDDVSLYSFSSQNNNHSQGGVTLPPASVGVSSGHRIAVQSGQDGNGRNLEQITDFSESVETPHSDAPGYKTDNSSMTVMENSTTGPEGITEKILADWLQGAGAQPGASWKQALEFLLPHARSQAETQLWYDIVKEQHEKQGKTGTIFWLNLAKDWVMAEAEARKQQAASEQPKIEHDKPMDQERANAFAQWLMGQGFAYEIVAIDKDKVTDQWYTCLEYGPGEWLYLEGPKHYNNPNEWELECIRRAFQQAA